jgi:hypothetical protein
MMFPKLATVLLAVCTMTSCSKNDSPTTPTPTSPTTSSFSSELRPGSSVARTFTTTQPGTITATLISIAPASPPVGLGIGIPDGGVSGCTLSTSVNIVPGSPATPLTATVDTVGPYCVALYDLGTLTDTVNFEITIVYP